MSVFLVDKYYLSQRSGSRSTKGFVRLYGAEGSATVRFTNDTPAPARKNGSELRFDYPAEMMQVVVDTLRNEKPIYVIYDDALTHVDIGAGDESVGDGEPGN